MIILLVTVQRGNCNPSTYICIVIHLNFLIYIKLHVFGKSFPGFRLLHDFTAIVLFSPVEILPTKSWQTDMYQNRDQLSEVLYMT